MDIKIDPDNNVPIYLQIVHAIKHLVAAGQLSPGQQLPTVRELAADLRINPNTVARSYDQLNGDGVISTQQGRGTYVHERPDQDNLASVRKEQLQIIMSEALGKALSRGYSKQEVLEAFETQLAQWTTAPES
jgi:GntR family transcriptional regulator